MCSVWTYQHQLQQTFGFRKVSGTMGIISAPKNAVRTTGYSSFGREIKETYKKSENNTKSNGGISTPKSSPASVGGVGDKGIVRKNLVSNNKDEKKDVEGITDKSKALEKVCATVETLKSIVEDVVDLIGNGGLAINDNLQLLNIEGGTSAKFTNNSSGSDMTNELDLEKLSEIFRKLKLENKNLEKVNNSEVNSSDVSGSSVASSRDGGGVGGTHVTPPAAAAAAAPVVVDSDFDLGYRINKLEKNENDLN